MFLVLGAQILKSQPLLIYLKHWTLKLNPPMVYPTVVGWLGYRISGPEQDFPGQTNFVMCHSYLRH